MDNQENPTVQAVPAAVSRPGVITWFYVYCWILVVMYFLLALMSLPFFLADSEEMEMPAAEDLIEGITMAVSGVVLCVAALLPLILRRRPWLWVYDLVIICLGMTSCCFLPACIPLLLFWIKPEVKEYFGRPK